MQVEVKVQVQVQVEVEVQVEVQVEVRARVLFLWLKTVGIDKSSSRSLVHGDDAYVRSATSRAAGFTTSR